jgi:hypothetical protein
MRTHAKLLLRRLPEGRLVGAEVGVFHGRLSRILLSRRPKLTLYMVDCWAPVPEGSGIGRNPFPNKPHKTGVFTQEYWDKVYKRVQRSRQRGGWGNRGKVMRCDSVEGARRAPNNLDFVFIDADHTEEAVRADIEAWLPKVRPGGLLAGHDYDRWGVTAAVKSVLGEGNYEVDGEGTDKSWYHWKANGTNPDPA